MKKNNYIAALKKRKSGTLLKSFAEGFCEVILELIIYISALAIGLLILAAVGAENKDEDTAMLIGMIPLVLVAVCVFAAYCVSRRKRRKATGGLTDAAPIPALPRECTKPEQLFAELAKQLTDVRRHGDAVRIYWREDVMQIEPAKGKKYSVAFNGERYERNLSAEDCFELAIEFAEDGRRDQKSIVISDKTVTSIDQDGIRYRDALLREHCIFFTQCKTESGAIGMKNESALFCVFYTGEVKTVISFKDTERLPRGERLLLGRRRERFRALVQKTEELGYILDNPLKV